MQLNTNKYVQYQTEDVSGCYPKNTENAPHFKYLEASLSKVSQKKYLNL